MFSGCGGLSRGFIDAGFEVLLGVDIDTAALQTFEYNHKGAIGFKGNLFDKDIIQKIDKAVPHCQNSCHPHPNNPNGGKGDNHGTIQCRTQTSNIKQTAIA